jgi:HSP20 family protein
VTDLLNHGPADVAEDARRLLVEIDSDAADGAESTPTADCRPPLDVIEAGNAIEIIMDIPGVPADRIRVAIRRSALLIVGSKPNRLPDTRGRFHVAERGYGRFARVVRLTGAWDASRATARVAGGLLRIIIPTRVERRGHSLPIPVEQG